MKTITAIIVVFFCFPLLGALVSSCQDLADAEVKYGDNIVARTICGELYFFDYTCTPADFDLLIKRSIQKCEEAPGTETSYRNEDGSLKHAIVIGEPGVANRPGAPFDLCLINWELDHKTAAKAFLDVCVNRKF